MIQHDGVTTAKSVDPEDPYENFGATILKEAALKQVDEVGDGTSVVICLAGAILNEGNKLISAGIKPQSLRRGLEEGAIKLVAELDKLAIPIKTLEEKIQVATISAENAELGKLIATTIDEAGEDGVVTVDSSKGTEAAVVEKQEGMQLDRGWASQFFITDPDNMIATLESSSVLVTDYKIETLAELQEFFADTLKNTKSLTIIAPDFSELALSLLVDNKIRGIFQVLAIKAPGFGQNQKDILQDIAILTGATFISKDAGMKLSDTRYAHLGKAGYISSKKDSTVITGGAGKKEDIATRVQTIKNLIPQTDQNFDKEKLRERLGKLTGKIAVIKVGGHTEIEMKEKKMRVEDSVEATKAAIKEGIIPGGEIVYLNIRQVLDKKDFAQKILYDALEKPLRTLVENAGFDSGNVLGEVMKRPPTEGFDVVEGGFKNMIESGIVDPVLVAKQAIQNAVSVSIQLLTTGAVSVPVIEEKKQ